jgi:hypothetical protein
VFVGVIVVVGVIVGVGVGARVKTPIPKEQLIV